MPATRRQFLRTTAAGVSLGLGEWAAVLLPISPASAEEAKVTPDLVRFGSDIEPFVRMIEDTPREKCPAMMIEQLRKGLPYRQFLAALYLANTVGAGDTFAGAFAVACASGVPLDEAIRFANAAGALATQKIGAQPSIPTSDAIAAFMASSGVARGCDSLD